MSEAHQIKVKIFVPGRDRKTDFHPPLTLDTVCEWIKLQELDSYTTNGLIELAGRYPTQALPSFRRNFNLMIQRVRQKRKFEQNPPIEPKENKDESQIS